VHKILQCVGGGIGCYIKLNLTALHGEFTEGEKLCSAILTFASIDRQCSNRSTACWHIFLQDQGLLRSCMGIDFRASCFMCNRAPLTAAVMGENITTDTLCSTQCLGDRLADCLEHQGRRTHQPKIPEMKTDSKAPISATSARTGYFVHFLYQKLWCIQYAKYFSKHNLVLFMEVREMDNTACSTLLVTFYSGHV
jgi:hypothetical protein